MRRAVLIWLSLLAAGCSGSSSSPTAASPTYPNILGGWLGTYTSNLNAPNVPQLTTSGGCTVSFTITTQNTSTFSGTWQNSGGFGAVSNCASSGTVSGSVSSTGSLQSLTFGTTVGVGIPAGCSLTNNTGYSGIVTTSSFNASATERYACPALGVSVLDVGRVLSLSKR